MMEAEVGLKYDQPKMTGGKRMVDGVQREWFGPYITKAGELEEEMNSAIRSRYLNKSSKDTERLPVTVTVYGDINELGDLC
jgi:hypothetical protein